MNSLRKATTGLVVALAIGGPANPAKAAEPLDLTPKIHAVAVDVNRRLSQWVQLQSADAATPPPRLAVAADKAPRPEPSAPADPPFRRGASVASMTIFAVSLPLRLLGCGIGLCF